MSKYYDRQNDAGKLTRRLVQEMEYLWQFLKEAGVEPANNHTVRILCIPPGGFEYIFDL
ncbi:hypothetical protein [Solidesulfovibrio magneticus]|uniref:hypothetical protein n=1 Tax=Solidesulfovibrio magneticus TaxID=184917 RepID=UPI0013051DD9|nr:hypothetical protein [Solidesulfovibrio magneticus]